MSSGLAKGDRVVIKSLSGTVGIIDGQPQETRRKLFYPVCINPNQPSSYYPEESLEKYVPPKSVKELLLAKEFADVNNFIKSLIYRKLEKPLSDNLYTFYASKTEFQVHQFKPVRKFLDTLKQRLLLADEVGLGKTIEAGIIITELSARLGGLPRVLIVCPSMLTPKWESEMRKRFALDFSILKRADLEKFLDQYAEYGEAEKIKGIVSLQTIRTSKMIKNLREINPHFDIVIVDEAHYMKNPETLSSELGEVLSELSDAMLFLSATPLQLGTPDLFNLLSLLIPEEFSDFGLFHKVIEPNQYINDTLRRLYDPVAALELLRKVESTSQRERFIKNPFYRESIEMLSSNKKLTHEQAIRLQKLLVELNCLSYIFTRTKKRDVEIQFPIREARVIRVQFTPEEIEFYKAVTEFVSEHFTAKRKVSQGISFAVIMPQRQVASCIQAMKENLNKIVSKKLKIIRAPSEDNGDVIDAFADEDISWKLESGEIVSFQRLKRSADKIGSVDTKFGKFLEALNRLEDEDPSAKILVFAFFKQTLEYLKNKLEATQYGRRVSLIHADIEVKERQRIIKKFRETDEIKILLSSEVGGEGLDFEFCNVIFNYDLPWNPMRVEQRIGRLDRYGQKHEKILIYNFSMAGTIDDEILKRLYLRINIFERYIGDLDAILGEEITELTKEMFNTELTYGQKIDKIEKVAENIARKQKDLQEFEEQCQQFIGQDEYFNQEITRILETKRFITSNEVMFFLKDFLKNNYTKTTLSPPKSGRDNVFILKCDDEFRRFVRQYSISSENIREIERKMSFESGALVTFNDQEACRDASLEFITIHHLIMKAIKRFYDGNKQNICSTACFRLKGKTEYEGDYMFFVYLLEKTALKKDLILIPVLVNLKNKKVHIIDEFCDWFLGEIIKAENISQETIAYQENDYEKAFNEAEEYLEMIRAEEEGKLKRTNDTLVNNQIESVKQATTIKVNRTKETIGKLLAQGKTDDEPIMRPWKARIRNFESSMEQKVKELEQKKAVSVAFNLIAGGMVKVEKSNN